jgi:hypothetical protein
LLFWGVACKYCEKFVNKLMSITAAKVDDRRNLVICMMYILFVACNVWCAVT